MGPALGFLCWRGLSLGLLPQFALQLVLTLLYLLRSITGRLNLSGPANDVGVEPSWATRVYFLRLLSTAGTPLAELRLLDETTVVAVFGDGFLAGTPLLCTLRQPQAARRA
jgi:hypothetical protein